MSGPPDGGSGTGTIHTLEEVELMVDEDLEAGEPPEAAIVARNAPESGRRYIVAAPEQYPAPAETVDRWVAAAEERYPLDSFADLDGGVVVGRPRYDEEFHRYGDEIRWVVDDEDLATE